MTLNDYLRVLRERWIVILTAIVLGLGGAAGIWFLRPPEYTAALTMYVSAQTADTTSTAYQGAQLSEQRVKSYVELVGSPRVCQEVVQNLRLAESPDDLAERITAVELDRLGAHRRQRDRPVSEAGRGHRQRRRAEPDPPGQRAGAAGRPGCAAAGRGADGPAGGPADRAVVDEPAGAAGPRPGRRARRRWRRGPAAQRAGHLDQGAGAAAPRHQRSEPRASSRSTRRCRSGR